ncbi:hypothetical protein [Desulfosarcina sp.]|uniref:hypothetical protein n=1 Tax=Desulfosarcina sp. TaxID=2027861 RepID=UPI003970BE86
MAIIIDSDLYENLRQYCDDCGIRFVDFVEEALENAIDREAILRKSEKADRILEQADRDRKLSFWRGFNQGVLAGILAGQGQLALSKNNSPPEESYPETPFKIVTGPQLKLFE